MVEALGMIFSTTAPDFGSIKQSKSNEYTLLNADISKLNSVLTRINIGSAFNVVNGAVALVLDNKKIYMYSGADDEWYEWGSVIVESSSEPET